MQKNMRILLFGEYSNVHWTLAEGLRELGHEVTVISDGDVWKDYPRDIDLKRKSLGRWDTLRYVMKVRKVTAQLTGYDIIQFINPIFLDLTAERVEPYYERLRRQNPQARFVLGAYGVDYYWVLEGLKADTFRYSDFYLYGQKRSYPYLDTMVSDWIHGYKGTLNVRMAQEADAIVTGLYEYDVCYRPHFPRKTTFIPFPINLQHSTPSARWREGEKIRFFIGIQKTRNYYKGTDIMLRALERLKERYPERMDIMKAESIPFAQYKDMMNQSHVLLDQLYSYTPGMNGLLAMSKGMVLVGGGEEEQYSIIHEDELRPIINVQPNEEEVVDELERRLLLCPQDIPRLQEESLKYVQRHHDHVKVAREYEALYKSLLQEETC